ncbi:putative leader peptide [Nakamurella panacisegetis]
MKAQASTGLAAIAHVVARLRSLLGVSRRHVDLQRVSSALCKA